MMELMSPAGSLEGVIAAVRGGADAVYFGTGDFNARRNAKNLEGEDLQEAMRFCRLRGVKTYVTLNTLLTDRELTRARETVLRLSELGADALIVQDLGVARMVRAAAPDLPIHASTQMTIHDLEGVKQAAELGFSRVVLSRELPLTEIEHICKHSPVEIEIFVHGALCMCYSGQCYLSAAIGGRSGNRGLCAQPCRMRYSFPGGEPGNPLSLKDVSMARHLAQLEAAGVHTLKIEGRMKRPEYTALVTKIYQSALRERREPTAAELEQLRTVFSREGFTDGYLLGQKGPQMFGTRQEESGREARALYKEAQAIYETQPEPPSVPVSMTFRARAGEEMTLTVRDRDGFSYETAGQEAEPALRRATTEEEIRSALGKTGGTVFFPETMDIQLDPGLRASAAAVNAMRRQALEGLALLRRKPPQRRTGEWQPGLRREGHPGEPEMILSFRSAEQLSGAILRTNPAMVWLPLGEIDRHRDMIRALGQKGIRFAAVLDRVCFDSQWPEQEERLGRLAQAGVRDVAVTNLGQLPRLRGRDFTLHGDFGLNIMNSQSIKELRQLGLDSCTLSFEMTLPQIRDMSLGLDSQILIYGRFPLMITENCIARNEGRGCPCDGSPTQLLDKTGRAFPVMKEEHCRTTLYNSEPLWLADKLEELSGLGLRWLRMNFTTETAEEIENILRAYAMGSAMPPHTTRGLYYRGVQ